MVGDQFKVPTLDGKNFTAWKYAMKAVLESNGLDTYVYGAVVAPDGIDKPLRAKSILISSLNEQYLLKIIHCNSAREIWTCLESIYEVKSARAVHMLWKQLINYKIETVNDLDRSIGDIQSTSSKLKALGVEIPESFIVTVIECSLPESFNPFLTSWELQDEEPSLNKLITKINSFAITLKYQSDNTAMLASHKPTPKPNDSSTAKSCKYCKKPGHLISECRKLKRKKAEQAEAKQPARVEMALMATTETGFQPTIWLADSGCSLHMTANLSWISEYTPLTDPINI